MSVISQTIANLFNGVSQQPPVLRSPTQGELQENGESSLVYGLSKRKPTRHIASIDNFQYTSAHCHLIEFGTERYVAFFDGSGTVRVWNADTGAACGVTISSLAAVYSSERAFYLTSASPRTDFKCLTVSATTLFINRSVTVNAFVTGTTTALAGTVQSFAQLPASPATGAYYRIAGTPDNNFLSYYVRWTGTVWQETAYTATALERTLLNPYRLPWRLIRTGLNAFLLDVPGFQVEPTVGDKDSLPPPSILNRQIRDLFLYRNRLGFITDSTIVMSRAGDFFNLNPQTMTAVLDDDPIDVSVAHPKTVNLQHAVPFNSNLILFGERNQFQLTASDVLSPRTARVDAITEFECNTGAKPVGIGPNVYFAQPGISHTLIRELFLRPDSLQTDAQDITQHVPRYLPTNVFALAASSLEDTLFALSSNDPRSVYVYRSKWKSDERIQSSWSKWTFGAFIDDSRVLGVMCAATYVYLVISRSVGTSIERLDFTDTTYTIRDGDGTNWLIHLDKQTRTYLSGIYDAANDRTTWTLPYELSMSVPIHVVVFGTGIDAGSGQWIQNTSRPSTNSVRAPGKWDTQLCLAGTPYTFRYRMSPVFMRDNEGVPAVSGRLQLRDISVMFRDTGYLRVEVTPFRRLTTSRVFSPLTAGLVSTGFSNVETGELKASVQSNAETVQLDFVNDSPYPSSVVAVEWTGQYASRTRRA